MAPKRIRVKGQVYVLADEPGAKPPAVETVHQIKAMSNLVDKVIENLVDVIKLVEKLSTLDWSFGKASPAFSYWSR